MNAYDRLRLTARLVALLPAFVVGLPLQALLVRLRSPLARRLPVLFHRYLAFVLGLRIHCRPGPPSGGAMLVLSNHVSWLDIVVVGALFPASFVAKNEVAGWPGAGTLARLQRTLFVDRQNRRAASASVVEIAARLAAGEAVVLFAEGTTSDGNRVLPFRSSLLAAVACDGASAVPLQPLALVYTGRSGLPAGRRERPDIAWYGDMELAPHLSALLGGGPIDVTVGLADPLPPGAGSRKDLSREAERRVRALVATIRSAAGPELRPGFDATGKAP